MFLNFNAAGTFNYLVAKETDGHFNFILHPIELEYSELAYLSVCLLLKRIFTTGWARKSVRLMTELTAEGPVLHTVFG